MAECNLPHGQTNEHVPSTEGNCYHSVSSHHLQQSDCSYRSLHCDLDKTPKALRCVETRVMLRLASSVLPIGRFLESIASCSKSKSTRQPAEFCCRHCASTICCSKHWLLRTVDRRNSVCDVKVVGRVDSNKIGERCIPITDLWGLRASEYTRRDQNSPKGQSLEARHQAVQPVC